jgi:hypothetical protein
MSSERGSSGDAAGSAERPLTFVGTTDICHRLASVGRGGRRRSIPPARTPPSRHRDARTGGRAGHSGGAQRAAPRLNRMDTLRIADERRWLEPRTCGRAAPSPRGGFHAPVRARTTAAASGTSSATLDRDRDRLLSGRQRAQHLQVAATFRPGRTLVLGGADASSTRETAHSHPDELSHGRTSSVLGGDESIAFAARRAAAGQLHGDAPAASGAAHSPLLYGVPDRVGRPCG